MRAGSGLLAGVSLVFVMTSGCKNSLNYAPPGGAIGCSDPGAICSVGYDDVGDGGPALEASLSDPTAVAYDASGNLYIADRSQNRIRKIDTSGDITTIAGTGEESYAFVGGLPGPDSVVASPIAVAVTDDGTVFWTDERSCVIYALSPSNGTVSIAAGSRCADGGGTEPQEALFRFSDCSRIHGRGNDLVIASTNNHTVFYWNRSAASSTVAGVSVPPGEVYEVGDSTYVCDAAVASDGALYTIEAEYLDCRARRFNPGGGFSYIAGIGGCGNGGDGGLATDSALQYPTGIALDEANDVVVITDDSGRVRVVNLLGGNQTYATVSLGSNGIGTIAGQTVFDWLLSDGVVATTQVFRGSPQSPVFGPDGNLTVADPENGVIRKIDLADDTMSVIAGFAGGSTRADYVNALSSVTVLPGGDLLVAGRSARVWRLGGGDREVFAGTGDPSFAGDGVLAPAAGVWATGVYADPAGRVFISDSRNHRVRIVDPASGTISTSAGNGDGYTSGDGGPAVNASFRGPFSAIVDSSGNLFIADAERIRYVNLSIAPIMVGGVLVVPGNIETIAGGNGESFYGDGGLAIDAAIRPNSSYTDFATGMAVQGRTLYFADTLNNRIRKVDLDTGIIDTLVGSGAGGPESVGEPVGLAIDDGWLYWTQLDGNFVKRMKLPSGSPEIVAGDGNRGYFGEGIHASRSQLIDPQGLAIGGNGNLYITDGSHRVRRIVP